MKCQVCCVTRFAFLKHVLKTVSEVSCGKGVRRHIQRTLTRDEDALYARNMECVSNEICRPIAEVIAVE